MKIVQTFWSGGQSPENVIKNTGGWLSAEYHWFAWSLSVLQLRKFYDEVELVTDSAGKHILIDVLALPYTSVRVVFDDALSKYDKRLWALAKIYAYSLQTKPFIHIDGDVFIWKPFEERLLNAHLIAQNFEIDFPFYYEPLRTVQALFKFVPTCMKTELEADAIIKSCNTGVIGGHDLGAFKEYAHLAFQFIDENVDLLDKVDLKHFNICFEQFLYYALAKEQKIEITYLVQNEVFDPTYPNFADFHDVPQKVTFIHAMAEYKRKEVVCNHLAKRLRQDYPEKYYQIIDLCQKQEIDLHWQSYPLEKLGANWLNFYQKDNANYKQVEVLFLKPEAEILETKLIFSTDCRIEEIEIPEYGQILHYPDASKLAYENQTLDNFNIILLDAFQEEITISQAIEAIKPYFPSTEIEENSQTLIDLVLARIKDLMFLGSLTSTYNPT